MTRRQRILLAAAVLLVALNGVALFHAHALLKFAPDGTTTKKPEELSWWEKVDVLVTGVTLARPTNEQTPVDVGLEFQTETFPSTDDHTLEAWILPVEQPRATVVIFHGYADTKDSQLPNALAWRAIDCQSVLVDLRGGGGSSGNMSTIGYHEAEDVEATIAFARERFPDLPLIAHGVSMGGAALLRSMAEHDVVVDGVVIESVFDRLLNAVGARFRTLGLPTFGLARLLTMWGGVVGGFNGFSHNPVEYAAQVDRPTLVLNGTQDPRVRLEQAYAIHSALQGPKQLIEFSVEEHVFLVEVDPAAWTRGAVWLLDQLPGGE